MSRGIGLDFESLAANLCVWSFTCFTVGVEHCANVNTNARLLLLSWGIQLLYNDMAHALVQL